MLTGDKNSGTHLTQELRLEGSMSVIVMRPQGDEVVRASTQAVLIEGGRVHLPQVASWLADFQAEILAFPNGRHDDQVDSLSQFLAGPMGLIDGARPQRMWGMEPIVERRFELNGTANVVLHLFKPEPNPGGRSWRCRYRIAWPDRERRFEGHGIDPLQALLLAIGMVHAELRTSEEARTGKLQWPGEGDLGLATPNVD